MLGKFIVLEGITSTGKTTQGKMLVDHLNGKGLRQSTRLSSRTGESVLGVPAFFNHEPTEHSPFGRIVRCLVDRKPCVKEDILEARKLSEKRKINSLLEILSKIEAGKDLMEIERQMLYIADRYDDLVNVIKPQIERGLICVQDRYELSTYAFAATKNIAFEQLKKIHDEMLGKLYKVPDILIYFDLDPEIAIARLFKASGKPVDIYETLPKIKKTKAAYEKLLGLEPRHHLISKTNEKVVAPPGASGFYKKLYIIDGRPPLLEIFQDICLKLNL